MTNFKPFVKFLRPKGPLSNHLLWVAPLVLSASSLENLQRLSLGVNTIAVILIWKLFYFISVWFWQQGLLACMETNYSLKTTCFNNLGGAELLLSLQKASLPTPAHLTEIICSFRFTLTSCPHSLILVQRKCNCLGIVCWCTVKKHLVEKYKKPKCQRQFWKSSVLLEGTCFYSIWGIQDEMSEVALR